MTIRSPWRYGVALLAAGAAIAAVVTSVPSAAGADPKPSCQTVTFSENSGNGPTYKHVHLCDVNARTNYLTVDGGPLQSGAVIFGSHASPSPASAPLGSPAALQGIAGCWGHNGVQLGPGLIGYECISQPSGLGGALYWSANEANFNWDKHPGSGLDWVEASTLHVTTDSNPPNNRQSFWVGIAHNGAFCTVINPGYDQHPTQCEEDGRVHPMTSKQQASYDQFAASMVATNVPDCAWSMTVQPDEAKCDIDS